MIREFSEYQVTKSFFFLHMLSLCERKGEILEREREREREELSSRLFVGRCQKRTHRATQPLDAQTDTISSLRGESKAVAAKPAARHTGQDIESGANAGRFSLVANDSSFSAHAR